jgi:N-acylglucosamine 2-epimerase
MLRSEIAAYRSQYEKELFESVVPFWERYSFDRECGGYYSCIDRDGTIFDSDKFLWMQGRELWGFSKLYNAVRPEARWLDAARLGADFLREHGKAPNGDWYFALDRSGRPLVQPYNIFSDCFCAAAFAGYSKASGEGWARDFAVGGYRRIQERKSNPKGIWTKQISENRPIKAMAMPMIQLWLAEEFADLIPEAELKPIVDASMDQVLNLHIDRKEHVVFERMFADGTHPDCMEGRLLNPGHALETLWLVLRVAEARGDRGLIEDVAEVMLWTVERGWDEKYGGIFYYQDFKGFPTEKLESSMKLWWVHVEAIMAFLLAYKLTGKEVYETWFKRIHDWTWTHFPDPANGEWFGYLDRRGEVALTLKGGKWKGFFHVPRALLNCATWLGEMERACAGGGEYKSPEERKMGARA